MKTTIWPHLSTLNLYFKASVLISQLQQTTGKGSSHSAFRNLSSRRKAQYSKISTWWSPLLSLSHGDLLSL